MTSAILEHVNFTVSDPKATAATLCDIFGWHIRWEGAAMDNGYTVHVGNADSYVALYSPNKTLNSKESSYATLGGLNHIAVTVSDLDATEAKVTAAGFATSNHGDYEPGHRFYFHDAEGIEFEVVCYD